ncbi:MAG: carbohydrate kinase, PfkB family [Fibrobacteres bacterium]|nr:carbohydrate kinase, PfkB family [Fibrobacterota bacterium]
MSRILVVGLNPAWQKVLGFRDFRPGEVNRAQSVSALASGKGINTAKVLRRLGHEVSLLQILGGENGRKCLESCEAMGIRSLHAWVKADTRQCLTLLHPGAAPRDDASVPGGAASGAAPWEATEIIEPFRVEEAGISRTLLDLLPESADSFDALAICGTVPAGVDGEIYAGLLERFRPAVSVVDAWQGLGPESLGKATCLKMNRWEYQSLMESLGPQAAGDAMFLVTSGGGEASVLRAAGEIARLEPPRLGAVVNPIGAGDTVTAGVVHHLLLGLDAVEAFRQGMAMGSASCLERLPAEYKDEEARRLLPLVRAPS